MKEASSHYLKTLLAATSFAVVAAALFSTPSQAGGQYDTSFLDRPNHKLKPTFQVTGNDFGKHTFHRMLLNSPYASSSVGLGANGRNPVYSSSTFQYMHPEADQINKPTQTQQEYIDNAYAPTLQSGYSSAYETDSSFKVQEDSHKFAQQEQKFAQQDNPFKDESKFDAAGQQNRPIEELLKPPSPREKVPNFLLDNSKGGKSDPGFF